MKLSARNVIKGRVAAAAVALIALILTAAPAAGRTVVDSAGRRVEVPDRVGRVFPAGGPAAILTGSADAVPAAVETVVFRVRGPRILGAMAVGAALAAAGAAYQGLFRNPLVSPDILGVSSGASLGAVLGIYLSLGVAGTQVLAFAGGLAAVAVVSVVGVALRRHDPVLTLVLAGIVVGSLASLTTADVLAVLPAVGLGLVPLGLLRWRMNVMTLTEDEARALGVDTGRMRIAVVTAATLMTAAAVSVSGVIGWIGLLIPHAARLLVGLARVFGYVPRALLGAFPFTVRQVVLMGRTAHLGLFATPARRDVEVAEAALAELGIAALAERSFLEISGGERQLVLIARALAQEPRVLVMDEPTASLDFGNQVHVLSRVQALAARGVAVILSTHDPDHALLCADRVALLHDGGLAALGPAPEVITAGRLRAVYGVDVEVVTVARGDGHRQAVCLPRLPAAREAER